VRAAALCLLSAVLLGCTASSSPTAAFSSGEATSARTGPVISPPPVTPPTPPGTNLPKFVCANAGGAGSLAIAGVTAVRVGSQAGYDRFVIQFDSPLVPSYTVKRQPKPVFTLSPSGQSITLSGTAGVLVQVRSASGATSYSGPSDFTQAGFPVLKEARRIEDFEGTVQWGLGLGSPACLRVLTLTDPARLVVDFQAPAS
jgi:hypothetical protein